MERITPDRSPDKQTVGIFTGGGIAPGLNAVIYGAINVLAEHGHRVIGIAEGWAGMLEQKPIVEFQSFTRDRLQSLLRKPGTILGSSRTKITPVQYDQVRKTADGYGLDSVIAIGGDDTLGQAAELHKHAVLNMIGVPKTIDNDVTDTDKTFGFETAYNEAAHHIIRMRTDAKAMKRVAGVEIMGRDAGWITLYGGYFGGADITLIPEFPIPIERIAEQVRHIYSEQQYVVIAIAEGYIKNAGEADAFGHPHKEDAARTLLQIIKKETGLPTEVQVSGYSVRNGPPLASDGIFAAELGAMAGLLAHQKKYGHMVSLRGNEVTAVPLENVHGGRRVTADHYDPSTMRKWTLPPNIMRERPAIQ
ncbi:ATP-dependent 6-phosphofructokinase [Candidatus Peregrinibacteria bacterium]|nr:ATP-dependent 6-phosphofructokinase [Candidatus Peregrinibacteria bacterium]